tara:strand:+ start:81 stop:623 length:543 start_codon:yes stop_codon:yes gene_type:complete
MQKATVGTVLVFTERRVTANGMQSLLFIQPAFSQAGLGSPFTDTPEHLCHYREMRWSLGRLHHVVEVVGGGDLLTGVAVVTGQESVVQAARAVAGIHRRCDEADNALPLLVSHECWKNSTPESMGQLADLPHPMKIFVEVNSLRTRREVYSISEMARWADPHSEVFTDFAPHKWRLPAGE